ncbi:MAG: BRCT domain-containing protein [Vicinamibacterales bacterium]
MANGSASRPYMARSGPDALTRTARPAGKRSGSDDDLLLRPGQEITAEEMIEALRNPPAALEPGALRSLKGMDLAFTGFLSKPRKEAMAAATRAGATVYGGPSSKTNVIVRGRPNKLQAAGKDGGLKLMEIKRLREKGQRITLLTEAQFWRLVAKRST